MPICLKAFSSSRRTAPKSIAADSRRATTFKSTHGRRSRICLNVSLVYRLILLRTTAQPTFLLTVTPRRAWLPSFSCQTTRNPLVANLWGEFKSLRNSERFLSRTDFGKHRRSTLPQVLLGCNANGQTFTAFGPSALDHETAVLGGHAYQKAMGTLAGGVAGLKCSFHIITPLNNCIRK